MTYLLKLNEPSAKCAYKKIYCCVVVYNVLQTDNCCALLKKTVVKYVVIMDVLLDEPTRIYTTIKSTARGKISTISDIITLLNPLGVI